MTLYYLNMGARDDIPGEASDNCPDCNHWIYECVCTCDGCEEHVDDCTCGLTENDPSINEKLAPRRVA